jgi:hypothetical protein
MSYRLQVEGKTGKAFFFLSVCPGAASAAREGLAPHARALHVRFPYLASGSKRRQILPERLNLPFISPQITPIKQKTEISYAGKDAKANMAKLKAM